MLEEILALCQHIGPSGQERSVQDALLASVASVADETGFDALGNALATKQGQGPHIALVAHADEAGIMIMDIDNNGFLRFVTIGDLSPSSLVNRHVEFVGGQSGVIGLEGDTKPDAITTDQLFVDIGAQSAQEAKSVVRIGLSGVLRDPVLALNQRRLAGRALDNRVGCAIAASAFTQLAAANRHVSVIFTAQHIPGARGVGTAAFSLQPDIAFVVDAVSTGDTPKAKRGSVELGKGPVLKVMDSTIIVPLPILRHLESVSTALGLPVQYEVQPHTLSDAGNLQRTRAGIPVGGIAYPARYVGGASTVIDLEDAQQVLTLLVDAAKSWSAS